MTVESTDRKQTYAGGQADHTFTFKALTTAPEDIKCLKTLISTGAETDLTYDVDYTVDLEDDGIGGVVTLNPTCSTLYTVTVYRVTTDKQESDYDDYNQFPADTLEGDLDRRTMISQERGDDSDRTLKLSISTSGVTTTLPTPVADQVLGWDSAGTAIENKDLTDLGTIVVDTDTTLAANSDAKVASQKATKTYADTKVKGDGTVNPTNLISNGNFESWSAGTSAAPDGWTLAGAGASVARDTLIKIGTYSSLVNRVTNDCYLSQQIHLPKGIAYWKGRTVTFSCWVYATVAERARIALVDSVGVTYSSYHTGDSSWQLLTVTKTVNAAATFVYPNCIVDTGATAAYFDGAMCVEGESAFAFSPKPISWVEGTVNPTNLLSNGNFESWSAGTSAAPDGWGFTGAGGGVARASAGPKIGTYYADITRGGADAYLAQDVAATKGLAYFKGRTITLGCWVNASTTSRARIFINDGVSSNSYSSYHTGGGSYEWLSCTMNIAATATQVIAGLIVDTGDTTAHFDGAMLVEGTSAFAFSPKPAEEGVWADYSAVSTVEGWASFTEKIIMTKKIGKTVVGTFSILGVSNQTYARFTVPYVSASTVVHFGGALNEAYNNGSILTTAARWEITDNSSTVNLYKDMAGAAWTNANAKNVRGNFWYESA